MEKNRNANTFEIPHEKFVCSLTLLFFFLKYNASCDEFWSRHHDPIFLLNLDPILAVFLTSGEYPNRGFQIALFLIYEAVFPAM